jgi:cephalosporin hydroxylase
MRSPQDGYARGLVQWDKGRLDAIAYDFDFRAAHALAVGKTVVTMPSLINLFLLMKDYVPRLAGYDPVSIVECGVAGGGSLLFLATLAKRFLFNNAEIVGIDTFDGHPADEIGDADWHKAGDFRVAPDIVTNLYRDLNVILPARVLRKRFRDAEPDLSESRVALCHIDADTKAGVTSAIELVMPRMVPGGYVVFDDPLHPTCLGAMEAVENEMVRKLGLNAEQACPHLVFRSP